MSGTSLFRRVIGAAAMQFLNFTTQEQSAVSLSCQLSVPLRGRTRLPALWHHTSGGNELLSTAVTTEGGGLSSVSVSDSLETGWAGRRQSSAEVVLTCDRR